MFLSYCFAGWFNKKVRNSHPGSVTLSAPWCTLLSGLFFLHANTAQPFQYFTESSHWEAMSLTLHFVADHISDPNRNKSSSVPSFQHSICWVWPKVPTVMPCIVVNISSLLFTHCLFMHDAHKILKDSSQLMTDTEDKSTGSAVALVTVSSGTWEAGALLCSQKPPWDLHDSMSDRDCTLLSLIQKSASLAFRRCCDSGLWIRIYHSDFCFCLQGLSQSQFNSLLGRIVVGLRLLDAFRFSRTSCKMLYINVLYMGPTTTTKKTLYLAQCKHELSN